MKKIFIISLISLVVVLLFLGIYNFAFKKSTSDGSQSMAQFSPQMQHTKAQATAAPTNEKMSTGEKINSPRAGEMRLAASASNK